MPCVSRLDVFVLIVVGGGVCERFFSRGEVREVSMLSTWGMSRKNREEMWGGWPWLPSHQAPHVLWSSSCLVFGVSFFTPSWVVLLVLP